MSYSTIKTVALIALLTGVYFIAGRLGLELAFLNRSASAVWPPTGLALGALLLFGYRVWPAIAVGAFLVNLTTSQSIGASLGISVGNTLEALTACFLVNRYANGRHALNRVADFFRFVFLAAGVSTIISATVGVLSLKIFGLAPNDQLGAIWFTWWLGDACGALIVAPLVLAWLDSFPGQLIKNRYWELVSFTLVLLIVSHFVFREAIFDSTKHYPLDFLCVPVIVWCAFRLGHHITTVALLALSAIAISSTLVGLGPFVIASPHESLLLLQTFLGLLSVSGLAIGANVLERQKAEMAAIAARNEEKRANELKDAFVATLSHELRAPLNAVLGWTTLMQRRQLDKSQLSEGLAVIERNTRLQAQLISDLLDMSRIIAGTMRLEKQQFDLRTIVESSVQSFLPAANDGGIHLAVTLSSSAVIVNGDAARLQQVIVNLLSNAIKFTPKDGKIAVVVKANESLAEVEVSDTGCGMSADFLPHLFERFRQADHSRTRKFGGLGLGLSISKELVELNSGKLSAYSAGKGKGSLFTIALPLVALVDPPHSQIASAQTSLTPALDGLTVLVVEDQEDARTLLCHVIEENRAEALSARSAEEALRLLKQNRPNVIISDIAMPDMDGFELIQRIRALTPAEGGLIPAIALTAMARPEDRNQAIQHGFQAHISKPIDATALVAAIRDVMV